MFNRVKPSLSVRPFWVAAVMALPMICGCGGEDAKTEGESKTQNASKDVKPQGSSETVAGNQAASDSGLKRDASGRQWYDNVPLDVWYDEPLQVATTAGTVATEPTPGPPDSGTPEPSDSGTEPTEPATASDDVDWGTIIPREQLLDEIKRIRNRLAQRMTSVSTFNGAVLELPPQIATLAIAADVVRLHPADISWKDNAKYISAYAGIMMSEPLQRGPATFRRLEGPFLNITGILEGNPPAEPPDADEEVDFSSHADFGDVMKRLEISLKWLQVNVGTADSLKENAEDALVEACVVAMLTKAIEAEGYGYSDDAEFKGYSGSMLQGSLQLAEAIKSDDFGKFEAGVSQIYKACTECHSSYRN